MVAMAIWHAEAGLPRDDRSPVSRGQELSLTCHSSSPQIRDDMTMGVLVVKGDLRPRCVATGHRDREYAWDSPSRMLALHANHI